MSHLISNGTQSRKQKKKKILLIGHDTGRKEFTLPAVFEGRENVSKLL